MQNTQSNGTLWAGRILTGLATLFLLGDGGFQILGRFVAPDALKAMMDAGGISVDLAPFLGSAILVSTILYAVPRTSVLGAILVTGYLGGAIATDVRVTGIGGPAQIVSALLAVCAWGGIYFRNAQLRRLLPFVQP